MRRFIIFMGLLSLLLDLYVFQGVKKITTSWRSARARKIVHGAYWLFFIGFSALFMYVVYLRFSSGLNTDFGKWVMNLFITFFVTKLVIILVLLAEDIFRFLAGVFNLLTISKPNDPKKAHWLPGRRKFVSQAALVLASIPFGAFIYGITKGKYKYTVHRHTLFYKDLPAAFNGFTITQLSDFHAGSFDDLDAVKAGLKLVQDQRSDLLVFTGDMVNNLATEAEPFIAELGKLSAPFGKFSVLGNHDYGLYHQWESKAAEAANLAALKKHQAAMGFKLLLDESVSIKKGNDEIKLAGVENWGKGFVQIGNLDEALKNVKPADFTVLLSHDPSHWEEKVKQHSQKVHLTLAGHTHGMQVGVETPLVRWSPAQFRYKTWAGFAEENGRKLYVNRGFGFIGFSGRVGIWPEITVLELRRG